MTEPHKARTVLGQLPFAHSLVDRDYRGRDDAELAKRPDSRFIVVAQGKALMSSADELAYLTVDTIPDGADLVYLGRIDVPYFAAVVSEATEGEWGDLRRIATRLSDRDVSLFVEALALTNWHATHRYSPHSGEPTVLTKSGWVIVDPTTGVEHFPRTDNAIIVAVTDADDRLLLGNAAGWEPNRYSLLAGFVEPGESLEAAVVREIFEESGIRVTNPCYLGSQPWPFPASLMIGFRAEVDLSVESTLTPDGVEIMDLRWFSRDELRDSLGEIRLPSRSSISRAIIEDWFGGPLLDEKPS